MYKEHISIFFLRRFNSTKNPSRSLWQEVISNLAGISFRMYKRIPPPLPFLWNLIGAAYPSTVNWLDRNVESNFVWEIINISKLPLMLFECYSNLFRTEFTFLWPIINLLMLAMCVAFNMLRKMCFRCSPRFYLSSWDWKSIFDCSRREYILVFGFVILASKYLYSRESVG